MTPGETAADLSLSGLNDFDKRLRRESFDLRKANIQIVQVNVGKLCNQTCVHCHVDAGPSRKEIMTRETMNAVLRLIEKSGAGTVDITGGAPELNSDFDYLVEQSRRLGCRVIDRCNLTVFYEPAKGYLPDFLACHQVEVVASLPCYSKENVDKQRGKGVFDKSIDALLWLNRLGYGKEGSGLFLNLVYNPVGPYLPPDQPELEADYKERLLEDFGITFNKLYTITNMPISRFAAYLRSTKQYQEYMELLINSFNPSTLEGLMCLNTLSIGWDGKLYDCDFNQMLDMAFDGSTGGKAITVHDLDPAALTNRIVDTGSHCFGCTAGTGSSCGGSLLSGDGPSGRHLPVI